MAQISFKRIVCGISGGVDSCVAALILKQKGYEVAGAYMYNWDIADETGYCTSEKDASDASDICNRLSIPFYTVNFVKEYWNDVFTSMVHDYEKGLTPNPDVLCNRKVKFDAFFNYALKDLGADAIATGHYARTSFGEELQFYDPLKGAYLLRGLDLVKDQSLFLSQIPQKALAKTLFPLGGLYKREVKQIAKNNGFGDVAAKKESTGICFIGKRKFSDFISEYIVSKPGRFIDLESNDVVGYHNGIHMWTVGQCCKISGKTVSYYVAKKDPKTQDIFVVPGTNHPALFAASLYTEIPFWIHSVPPELEFKGTMNAEFRFQHVADPPVNCTVSLLKEGNLFIELCQYMRALTQGQYAVLYNGDVCLGSARIAHVTSLLFDGSNSKQTFTKLVS